MDKQKIVFIGGGNMGSCLIGGLIADGYSADAIHLIDPDPIKSDGLKQQYQIHVHTDATAALENAIIVVLAVKPQVMQSVIEGILPSLSDEQPLFMSVAAGITTGILAASLGEDAAIVRTMPNTPAMVGSGATALFANDNTNAEQRAQAESVMRAVGIIQWLDDESLMDIVTAVSGSGPAYFFRMMEAMENAAEKLGLPQEQARLLTIQTALGAARMALESSHDPGTLRVQVTSPGGTTEKALQVFDKNEIDRIFEEALSAAKTRSIEMAKELSR